MNRLLLPVGESVLLYDDGERYRNHLSPLSRSLCTWKGLKRTSHFIDAPDKSHTLHLLQISREDGGSNDPPCLLLHGAVENGRIFYSPNGKGLGPYLARAGNNVFVPDMRGKGMSTPFIKEEKRNAVYGIKEITTKSIPLFARTVREISGHSRQAWVSHSIGGVLMASAMARDPSLISMVSSQVHFATKRRIRCNSLQSWVLLNITYGVVCQALIHMYGFLPGAKFGIGVDDETKIAYENGRIWARDIPGSWVDLEDDFDYGAAYKAQVYDRGLVPPMLLLGARRDLLATEQDVLSWGREVGARKTSILSMSAGSMEDYDHFSILTSPSCNDDHFPHVATWIKHHHNSGSY